MIVQVFTLNLHFFADYRVGQSLNFRMRSTAGLLKSSVAFLYVVGIVGKAAVATEETPSSSMNLQHYNTMLNSVGFDDPMPEKRAYTYVSEYKRLPVYNFGIGKRWVDSSEDKVRLRNNIFTMTMTMKLCVIQPSIP